MVKLFAQQVATVALDLVFPPHCVNCERAGSFLCARCLATVEAAQQRGIAGLDDVRVAVAYTHAASAAIHAFKYEGQVQLVEMLGGWLCELLDGISGIDCVVAVPLHPQREAMRGYNQAALLASHVARHYGWAFVPEAVSRIRETPSQVNLTAQERRDNVNGAFAAEPTHAAGRHILLIDDVLTTGATLVACAEALRGAGAKYIAGAAVASPVLSD